MNQGVTTGRNDERRDAAFRPILFHPDFNRRLWNLTRSADPSSRWWRRSRASHAWVTAGGEFHPAL